MAAEANINANSAFVDDDFTTALDLYSQAIQLDPSNSEYLVNRAAVHLKLENYADAVADCNKSIAMNPSNAKAYMRKGIACFNIDEFETAKDAFEKGHAIESGNNQFKTWIRKCDAELEEEEEEESSVAPPSAPAKPVAQSSNSSTPPSAPAPAPAPAPPKARFRHEYYQNGTNVVVTIYIKGAKAENTTLEMRPSELELDVQLSKDDTFSVHWDLFAEIIPEQSKVSYGATKIELTLKKKSPMKWEKLEGDGTGMSSLMQAVNEPTAKDAKIDLYPSSQGKKDWDKIAEEETAGDKPEGDEALNSFFQQIYGKASEETRRAMNKSFVESGGTVLSTNWSEVGSGEVKGSPPKGMDMKSWNEAYK